MEKNDSYNPPDGRGVHKERFRWKTKVMTTVKNVKSIWMKMDATFPRYYFEEIIDEMNVTALNEILNVKILKLLESESKNFKVIGAKGRNVIIGEINLKQFEIPTEKLLILCSLIDWRKFSGHS